MNGSGDARFKLAHADALRFQQPQSKQGFADLNRQRLAATRAAPEHPDRFAGNEAEFTQSVQSCRTDLGAIRHQTFYQGM